MSTTSSTRTRQFFCRHQVDQLVGAVQKRLCDSLGRGTHLRRQPYEEFSDVYDMQAGDGGARWLYFVFFISTSMTRSGLSPTLMPS